MAERKKEQNAAIDAIDEEIDAIDADIEYRRDQLNGYRAEIVTANQNQLNALKAQIGLVRSDIQGLLRQRQLIVEQMDGDERPEQEQLLQRVRLEQELLQRELRQREQQLPLEHQQLLRDANEKNDQLRKQREQQLELELRERELRERLPPLQQLEQLLPPLALRPQRRLEDEQRLEDEHEQRLERRRLEELQQQQRLKEIHGLVREFRKELKGTLDEIEHAIALLDEMGYEIDQGLEKIEKGSQSESEGESEEY